MKALQLSLLVLFSSCARTPSFPPGNEASIATLEKLMVNGDEQHLLIRGKNRNNPVLLFLHGGPGMPMMYLSHKFQRTLEDDFVVVHWDQRLAGKSFKKEFNREKIRVSQYLSDAQVVVEYLLTKLRKKKIFLAGHSWGSYLGVLLASEHPEFFSAYIGIGQVVNDQQALELQNDFLQSQAVKTGDKKAQDRLSEGTSWYEYYLFKYGAELKNHKSFWPLVWAGLGSKEYSIKDVLNVKNGSSTSSKLMIYDETRNLMTDRSQFEIPVFFFMGVADMVTPLSQAQDYLEVIHAPFKQMIIFDASAHFPFFEEPQLFSKHLIQIKREVLKGSDH